jgi:SAM-dependent methyltransferase
VRGAGKLIGGLRRLARAAIPADDRLRLNDTQRMFVEWNAARLRISAEESLRRYERSWAAVHGGHGGRQFRDWDIALCELFQVFISDSPSEVYAAYEFHGPLAFLRMLSYDEHYWGGDDLVIRELLKHERVDILDFGCGLAQKSRGMAAALSDRGVTIGLHLADIPTVRKEFLLWMGRTGRMAGIMNFMDCTIDHPIPPLPECDVCIATEFFEHVYDPVKYLDCFDSALRPGGFLLTNIADHEAEFMHVHPNLSDVRARIAELVYDEIAPYQVFRKPMLEINST